MVKCADCGFLGLRRGDGELIEADYTYRTTGVRDIPHSGPLVHIAKEPRPSVDVVDTSYPRCLVVPDMDFRSRLYDVFPDWDGKITSYKDRVPAWEIEWNCSSFFQWHPGLAPKEHIAMMERARIDEREDRRDAIMNAREDARDLAMTAREDRRDIESRGRHRDQIWVLGVLLIIATLIGSVVQAGWIPNPRGTGNQIVTVVVATATPQSTLDTSGGQR